MLITKQQLRHWQSESHNGRLSYGFVGKGERI